MLSVHITIYYYNKALLANISLEHLLLVMTLPPLPVGHFHLSGRPLLLVKGMCFCAWAVIYRTTCNLIILKDTRKCDQDTCPEAN